MGKPEEPWHCGHFPDCSGDPLVDLDVPGLPALRAFRHVELNGLTFLERAEAVALKLL